MTTELAIGQAYPTAPITEAVVALTFSDKASVASLKGASKRLGDSLENEQVQAVQSIQLNFPSVEAKVKKESDLFRRSNSDETKIVCLRNDSVSCSVLAPYSGWDEYISFIDESYSKLSKFLKGREVCRVGMRYINRIDVPLDVKGTAVFEDYLELRINIPDIVPEVGHYSFQFQTKINDLNLIVQSGVIETVIPKTAAFLIDIDLSDVRKFWYDHDRFIQIISKMRPIKNQLFESFIKDKARDLFHGKP